MTVNACPYLNPVPVCTLGVLLVMRYASRVAQAAAMPATNGATMAGSRTLETITQPCTEAIPAPTMTAPIRPPNRACEELDGRPKSQVIRFQTIAPINPARMIEGVISWSSKKPPEIVFATAVERQAPTRLRKAPRITAVRGRIAPVAIGPAIALALSWNPLV